MKPIKLSADDRSVYEDGFNDFAVFKAEGCNNLPAHRHSDGRVMTAWELTDDERKCIADGGVVQMVLWTGGKVPPMILGVRPEFVPPAVYHGKVSDEFLNLLGAKKALAQAGDNIPAVPAYVVVKRESSGGDLWFWDNAHRRWRRSMSLKYAWADELSTKYISASLVDSFIMTFYLRSNETPAQKYDNLTEVPAGQYIIARRDSISGTLRFWDIAGFWRSMVVLNCVWGDEQEAKAKSEYLTDSFVMAFYLKRSRTMKQIKIFSHYDPTKIEAEVNDFLRHNPGWVLVSHTHQLHQCEFHTIVLAREQECANPLKIRVYVVAKRDLRNDDNLLFWDNELGRWQESMSLKYAWADMQHAIDVSEKVEDSFVRYFYLTKE